MLLVLCMTYELFFVRDSLIVSPKLSTPEKKKRKTTVIKEFTYSKGRSVFNTSTPETRALTNVIASRGKVFHVTTPARMANEIET